LSPCWPSLPPDQLSLQRFEERLDGCVVITITFAAHRWLEFVFLEPLLVIVGSILAAAITMEDAVLRRIPEICGHVQRPDRQILLHPVADRPANDPAAVKVENDR